MPPSTAAAFEPAELTTSPFSIPTASVHSCFTYGVAACFFEALWLSPILSLLPHLPSPVPLPVNWCSHWFEYFPNPPLNILAIVENLLTYHDHKLLEHFVQYGITSQVWGALV